MREVLGYQSQPSLAHRMGDAFTAGDSARAIALHRQYRADPRHRYAETEIALNGLGYELLRQGRRGHAIAVMRLNAADHPGSSNAFDSLGEAYMEAGMREEAIRSYGRAVTLDPANQNAAQMLEKLRAGADATPAGGTPARSGAARAAPPPSGSGR